VRIAVLNQLEWGAQFRSRPKPKVDLVSGVLFVQARSFVSHAKMLPQRSLQLNPDLSKPGLRLSPASSNANGREWTRMDPIWETVKEMVAFLT